MNYLFFRIFFKVLLFFELLKVLNVLNLRFFMTYMYKDFFEINNMFLRENNLFLMIFVLSSENINFILRVYI